jgi:hypothetical protein
MRYRAPATPRGSLFFCLCTALSVVCLGLFALPAPAQEGPLPGTPAQGTNPDSPSSPPDVVTIAAQGGTVSEGASITLEDPDGTNALFIDGQLEIEITSTGARGGGGRSRAPGQGGDRPSRRIGQGPNLGRSQASLRSPACLDTRHARGHFAPRQALGTHRALFVTGPHLAESLARSPETGDVLSGRPL